MARRIQRNIIREIQRLHSRREPLNIPAVKRNHPKLVASVYAVRPFWGWKRALEDAGLDYSKINVELLDYIDCKICGGTLGTLPAHLHRKHAVTVEEYREEYEDPETTCETGRAVLVRMRTRKHPVIPRWEAIATPEYVLDRLAELRRRNFPLNLFWASNNDPALVGMVRKYFGSWDAALRRIGLDPKQVRLARPTEHLTAEQVLARLKQRRDDPPRQKEDFGLANAATKYFGSWNAALRAAGIEPQAGKSEWADANKSAIVREIRRRKRLGESVRAGTVVKAKHGRALQDRARSLFGSWNMALRAAGIEPAKENSRWTKATRAALIAEIRRRKRAGEPLETTQIEREKWGHPLMNRARTLFGSWTAAILAADVDPPAGLTSPWVRANRGEILSEIRLRKRAGKPLHASRIEREQWGSPLVQRSRKLFGSWNETLLAAGVSLPAHAYLQSPWPHANQAAILREIRRRKRAGESWRYGQIQKEQWGKPLLRRGGELFGSWSAALRAVGIEPVKENSPWPKADKAVILREIRRRHRADRSVASGRIKKEKWGRPLLGRAKALFGSWNSALLAAGVDRIDLPKRRRWSGADKFAVVTEIRRRQSSSESLRSTEVDPPLLRRSRSLFGSWKNALAAAGIHLGDRRRKTRARNRN